MAIETPRVDLDATYEAINSQNGGRGIGYTLNGVHGYFRVEDGRCGSRLIHEASARGRKSEAYRENRRMLGDDYLSCFDVEWPDVFWGIVQKRGLMRFVDAPKTWIITGDGKAAWEWDNPRNRVELADPDAFIMEREAAGDKIGADDRYATGPSNVWD